MTKHPVTIRRELTRIKAEMARDDLSPRDRSEMYGAQQALAWALGRDACAPHKLTSIAK